MKYLVLVLVSIWVSGCSNEKSIETNPVVVCPSSKPTHHWLQFDFFSNSLVYPENFSIFFNGEKVISTCLDWDVPDWPSYRYTWRLEDPKISLYANIKSSFEDLPTEVDIDVVDEKKCENSSSILISAKKIKVDYSYEFVGPESCNVKWVRNAITKVSID